MKGDRSAPSFHILIEDDKNTIYLTYVTKAIYFIHMSSLSNYHSYE